MTVVVDDGHEDGWKEKGVHHKYEKRLDMSQGMKEFVEDSIRNLCNLFAILFAIYGFDLICTFMQYFNRVMQSARYTDFQNAKLFMKTSIKKHDDWNFDTLLLLVVKI